MTRSNNPDEKIQTFGDGFYGMYQENENLSSVISYPDRGSWGNSGYRGNCSGYLVKDLILRFDCKSVFDPAEGGGTVKDVVSGINRYGQKNNSCEGRDLKTGFDILNGQMPSEHCYNPA